MLFINCRLCVSLGRTKSGPVIQHMWDQEKDHLKLFEKLIPKYRARPTALLPIWNVAGFVLGAGNIIKISYEK